MAQYLTLNHNKSNILKYNYKYMEEKKQKLMSFKLFETIAPNKILRLDKDYDIKRWFDEGEIVKFSLDRKTNENAKFIINGDKKHEIWFSQIANIFLSLEEENVFIPTIILKDGSEHEFDFYSDPDDFINLVKDRKFKVTIDPAIICIDKDSHKFIRLFEEPNWPSIGCIYTKFVEYFYDNLKNENIEALSNLTKKGICYNFIEI